MSTEAHGPGITLSPASIALWAALASLFGTGFWAYEKLNERTSALGIAIQKEEGERRTDDKALQVEVSMLKEQISRREPARR